MTKKPLGMTLIELLIAVVIIGVLASIAYPAYTDHVKASHRKQALADMAKIRLHLEQKYNGSYVTAANQISTSSVCNTTTCDTDTDRYRITIEDVDANGYKIKATPQSTKGQNTHSCHGANAMTLDQTGAGLPADCWK